MYLTRDSTVDDYEEYNPSGVNGVFRKRLLNNENSSKSFALRTYIIKPNGHTALDMHEHEHGVYVMKGSAKVFVNDTELTLAAGDVIHIDSNEPHQFRNDGSEDVKFLCVRDYSTS
jgi:quercetin dioxygenase-like cupin family protein